MSGPGLRGLGAFGKIETNYSFRIVTPWANTRAKSA